MNTPNTNPAVAETKPAVVKDTANGVTRPKAGTTCARVWDICNKLSETAGAPAERAKVIAEATAEGINAATVATQHGKWRKYYGLTAATPEAKAEKEKEVAAAKAKKLADAEVKKAAAAAAKAEKAAAKTAKAKAKADAAAKTPATTGGSDVLVETGTAAQ